MRADWPSLLHHAELLIRAIAGEPLNGEPIYLVLQEGSPFRGSALVAFTGPNLDLILQQHLGARWNGRGVAVVLNADLLERENPQELETALNGMVLHEFAHSLAEDYATLRADIPQAKLPAIQTIMQAAVTGHMADEVMTAAAEESEFRTHDEKWIRVCVHLARRARAIGCYVPTIRVIGHREHLRRPETFELDLRDEPERMQAWPFSRILQEPLPVAFAGLWAEAEEAFEESRHEAARIVAEPQGLFSEESEMNVLEKVLTKIGLKVKERESQIAIDFAGLTRALADNKEVNADIAEQTLRASGKTTQDLAAEVDRLVRRRAARADVQRASQVDAERAKIQLQIDAADVALEEANQVYIAATRPLAVRLNELKAVAFAGEAAERFLRETASAEVKRQVEAPKLREALQKRDGLTIARRNLLTTAEQRRTTASTSRNLEHEFEYIKEAEGLEEQAAAIAEELAQLAEEITALEAEDSRARLVLLEP